MTKTSKKRVKEFAILIPTAPRTADANGPEAYSSRTSCDVAAASMQSSPHEEEIRELAYRKWAAAGYPPGDGVNFWLEAEQELATESEVN